jgi:hypothetical protein
LAAARRHGYEPFSLPNAAFMVVVNLLLLAALTPWSAGPAGAEPSAVRTYAMLGGALVLAGWMLVVIARRAGPWYGLYAVALMCVGAIGILPSLVFIRLAEASAVRDVEGAGDVPADGEARHVIRTPPGREDDPRR